MNEKVRSPAPDANPATDPAVATATPAQTDGPLNPDPATAPDSAPTTTAPPAAAVTAPDSATAPTQPDPAAAPVQPDPAQAPTQPDEAEAPATPEPEAALMAEGITPNPGSADPAAASAPTSAEPPVEADTAEPEAEELPELDLIELTKTRTQRAALITGYEQLTSGARLHFENGAQMYVPADFVGMYKPTAGMVYLEFEVTDDEGETHTAQEVAEADTIADWENAELVLGQPEIPE